MKVHSKFIDSISEYYVYAPSLTARQLFFYPTHIGLYHYLAGYSLKRSHFDNFLLMLILDGECDLILNGEYFHAKKGALVLIDCYLPHQYESSCGWRALWLHFNGPLAKTYYDFLSNEYGNVILPSDYFAIYQNLRELLTLFHSSDKLCESDISVKITQTLNLLISPPVDNLCQNHAPVRDVILYINEHFAKPLTLEMLSEKACLSPFYFTRVFTKETGMTPYQYLLSTRISAAKFLLKSTSVSIKEIACRCGFTSSSGFCTAFKKWENLTPKEYRDKA